MADPLLDDVQCLTCFARVVEAGSFTAAAQRLGVSKSVVSTKVAALERRLGEPLLLRTTRRVSVTGAGARVYNHARELVTATVAATSAASNVGQGLIRISAPVTLSQLYLARPIADLLAEHPGVQVELLLNDRFVDLVEERIDLALRITRLSDSNLMARLLAETPIDVCGSPGYFAKYGRPTRPEQLIRHNCLRYGLMRADHEWRFYERGKRMELALHGTFESTNGTMLREAAVAGLGVAILPRFMIQDALERGELESVLSEFSPRPMGIYAVRSGPRTTPKLLSELLRRLESSFRASAWAVKRR